MSENAMEVQRTAQMEMETASSSYDDTNPCPICLGTIIRPSYLDKCFRKPFRVHIIASSSSKKIETTASLLWVALISFVTIALCNGPKWSLASAPAFFSSVKCPLCKTESSSIIHGLDGHCFQRHYVNQDFQDSFILSKAHKYRLQCYYTEPGFLEDIFNVQRYWKLRKYLQANQWLEVWLKRELQALIQEEDVDIIMHHLLGLINPFLKMNKKYQTESPELKREKFSSMVHDAAKPFLSARADRFVHELELFLASGLNIEAYDSVYLQRLGWSEPVVPSVAIKEVLGLKPVTPYLYIFDYDPDEGE